MLFYASTAAAFFALMFAFYRYRTTGNILPHFHLPASIASRFPALQHYTPLSTFSDQAAAGFTSSNFDIEAANIEGEDSRIGLDEAGVNEVQEIMRRERVTFDQARLIRQNRILAANGIDPSGMPLDSKAVTRL